MNTFQEHLDILFDETLINESPSICDVDITKLRSPTMKAMHKKQCSAVHKKEKDTPMRRAAKRAGMKRTNRDKLYNEVE
jgi:hypothetical protein